MFLLADMAFIHKSVLVLITLLGVFWIVSLSFFKAYYSATSVCSLLYSALWVLHHIVPAGLTNMADESFITSLRYFACTASSLCQFSGFLRLSFSTSHTYSHTDVLWLGSCNYPSQIRSYWLACFTEFCYRNDWDAISRTDITCDFAFH